MTPRPTLRIWYSARITDISDMALGYGSSVGEEAARSKPKPTTPPAFQ